MTIHHYASIETLALILKNKTIRFNRLDLVDDMQEATIDCGEGVQLGHYIYVSCWTKSNEENIALWKMYTPNAKGVRISIDDSALFPKLCINGIKNGETIENECYFIPGTNNDSIQDIRYISEENQIEKGISNDYKIYLSKIGVYKNIMWEFQKESRFKLLAIPLLTKMLFHNNQEIIKDLQDDSNYPTVLSYDRYMSKHALDNLTITLGPLCNLADRIIVEALINQYCPNARLEESKLTGKIRK